MSLKTVDEFALERNGGSWDYDKKYGAQCVDLFNYYEQEVVGGGFIGTPKTGGARDLWEVSSDERNKNYNLLPASTPLQKGDVGVFGDGVGRITENGKTIDYGHVWIYLGDNKVLQQNKGFSQKTSIDQVFTKGMIGILRPKIFANAAQAAAPSAPDGEFYTIAEGNTFWELEGIMGVAHGSLQQLNPGVDPKNLQIGQQIRIRPATSSPAIGQQEGYQIKQNDTFWDLENAWQLPHGRLQELNPGINPRLLQIGQTIRKS